MEDIRQIENSFDKAVAMIRLSKTIDDAQEYFMALAENHTEVTLTFKNTAPFVTVFLGNGPHAKIGFGSSVAGALLDAMKSA